MVCEMMTHFVATKGKDKDKGKGKGQGKGKGKGKTQYVAGSWARLGPDPSLQVPAPFKMQARSAPMKIKRWALSIRRLTVMIVHVQGPRAKH